MFYASLSEFTLDMSKIVPQQVVYYQYCIGGRAVISMLLDETKKKRGFKLVFESIK